MAMNRRDFLLLRSDGDQHIAVLSCQSLFMHFQDLCAGVNQAEAEAGTLEEADWWAGEPPLDLHTMEPDTFFRSVQTELLQAHKLRVDDMQWMAQGDFRIRVETLLAAFKAAGGEVSYAQEESESELVSEEVIRSAESTAAKDVE